MHILQVVGQSDGTVRIGWQREGALIRFCPGSRAFKNPLSVGDRETLRWYLEDFLSFPYGAERDRAVLIEKRMEDWGKELFGQVFPSHSDNPSPRDFYQEAVREGLDHCELCISAEDVGVTDEDADWIAPFFEVPWELLRDPTPGRGYLAPLLAGLFRQRSGHAIAAPRLAKKPGEPFRILLVIARPYGEADIPLRTVARPMLEALRPLRPQVELTVLRPPTFDALQATLRERRGAFDLVHFDGHGSFTGERPAGKFGAMAQRGCLVFETPEGEPHLVNSHELGQALAACQVPLFVLNACQSAQQSGSDAYSSVAAQLVAVGADGVVAMSYSVYARTASLFIERFYERLVNHSTLAEAVAAARQRLYTLPLAPRSWENSSSVTGWSPRCISK